MGSGRDEGGWRDDRGQRGMYDDNRSDSYSQRGRPGGGSGERGFFERAGDEISSWFGDDEAERRREMDERSRSGGQGDHRDQYRPQPRGEQRPEYGARDPRHEQYERPTYAQQRSFGSDRPRDRDYPGTGARRPDMNRPGEYRDTAMERSRDMSRDQSGYRPLTGDYGRSAAERHSPDYMPSGAAQGGATSAHDRHYSEWRQRQIADLDRDYDEYRREHQSKFESDFSNWRSTRQSKRQMLGSIKEHMQVVGSDDQPLGTVDKVRGDRLILTKADSPDGQHHSVNCTMIDRVDGDRVVLDRQAEEAKALFGNEERDRSLAERDDTGEPGAHILNRSFSGTY